MIYYYHKFISIHFEFIIVNKQTQTIQQGITKKYDYKQYQFINLYLISYNRHNIFMTTNNSLNQLIFAPFLSPYDTFLKGFSKFLPPLYANSRWTKINILIGLFAAFSIKKYLFGRFLNYMSKLFIKPPSLLQKYGEDSWVLIIDAKNNQDYAIQLGKQGFNLILLGKNQDIDAITQLLNKNSIKSKVVKYVIDWKNNYRSEVTYQKIYDQFVNFDISFIVTPKIQIGQKRIFCKESLIPITNHTYLVIHRFLKKLKDRSYRSAIIINSHPKREQIEEGFALQYGSITAIDFFGRYLNYQMKHFCEVIVVRNTRDIKNVLKNLGQKIVID